LQYYVMNDHTVVYDTFYIYSNKYLMFENWVLRRTFRPKEELEKTA